MQLNRETLSCWRRIESTSIRVSGRRWSASESAARPAKPTSQPSPASFQATNYTLNLLAHHGTWYVLAHNPAKGRVETFDLSRFRPIEGLGMTSVSP